MKYIKYFFSMTESEQNEYAVNAGTTGDYLRSHIFVPMERRKIPRKELIRDLVSASNEKVSLDDVLDFLYKSESGRRAA